MRNNYSKIFILSCLILHSVYSTAQIKLQRIRSFDAGWKFLNDSVISAEHPDYNDANWRKLDLPHDWSIEDITPQVEGETIGPFSKKSPGGMATGHFLGGTGWYRKNFTLNAADSKKQISVYFEGAYMETDVWVNGHHVGANKNGYSSFYFDITKYCKPQGEPNVIAVRVVNKGKNSRWYSGSGIYRHVKLIVNEPIHFDQWGVYITTPKVSEQLATVNIQSKILNETNKNSDVKIRIHLLDAGNKEVAKSEIRKSIAASGSIDVVQTIKLQNPKLWSVNAPHLYKAVVAVLVNGKIKDQNTISFGIRSISITAEKGFLLNGISMKLKGGCVHHDNGILGAAAIDRAEERRVELLKSNGFNAIRCSHNPPSEKFLEACDRLGMLVIDEAFDHWQKQKNPNDYHRFFDAYWEKDFTSMILRDRNHPSVILWSVGNEIEERAEPSGLEITKRFKAKVMELDPSRMITEAINEPWDHKGEKWSYTEPAFALLDVGGYNYQWWEYENDHKKFPDRIMMGTESVPKHAVQNWNLVEKHPYVIGDFVWTAMDYLGESGIGHTSCENEKGDFLKPWPWFNAWCGDIDLIGNKKPQSYYRDIVWRRRKITMAVHAPLPDSCKERVSYWGWPDEQQSWNWPGNEGKMMNVNVYSRASKVRLKLNGKTIDEKVPDSLLTATFKLPYTPGELKAVTIENGKETGTFILATTGASKKIRLKADRTTINADRNDLSYISVEITDENGNVIPDATIPVQFSLSGNGELAGVGNANPSDMAGFKQNNRKTFRGKLLVIVRPSGVEGNITLHAKANGLKDASIVLTTKKDR